MVLAPDPSTALPETGFGERLRMWRQRQGMSQLELGLRAEVSARHISFLETGRSRPSRSMVLRLAGALEVPLRSRNELLLVAGFAPRYGERSFDDAELGEARRALRLILDTHEPNPAFVLDRMWRIVLWNRTQGYMLREVHGEGGSPADLNALDLVFEPGPLRDSLVNWEEVAAAVLRRLRRQLARLDAADPLHETWRRIRALPGVAELDLAEDPGTRAAALVPMRMRAGDEVLTWFSTLAVFGATGDVTLEELVIESFFPGDDVTRRYVARLAAAR